MREIRKQSAHKLELCQNKWRKCFVAESKTKKRGPITTEAEYVAACEGAKELIWLQLLRSEIRTVNSIPVLFVDDMRAIKFEKK